MNHLRLTTLAAVMGIFPIASLSQTPPSYTVTNLGTLSGGTESRAYAINSTGQVVGESTVAGTTRGFLYTGGALIDVGSLGGPSSRAIAINDAGQIAGDSRTANLRTHGFKKTGALIDDVGTLGGQNSRALAINVQGLIAGCADQANAESHAYLLGTLMTNLGTLGGSYSCAFGLNDLGHAAGESLRSDDITTHAFLYNGSSLIDLGTLGGRDSFGYAINNGGQVAGESLLKDWTLHAFLYSGGVMQDLGTLGGSGSAALGLNDPGAVVGRSWTQNDAAEHAFIYLGGKMHDLNNYIPAGSGWTLIEARAINKSGQIVGYGTLAGQGTLAFLLTPGVTNRPPVANAGSSWKGECKDPSGAEVTLDGSASKDPDGDPLTFEWTWASGKATGQKVSVKFPRGNHSVTLTVEDGKGGKDTATIEVAVVDNSAPTLEVNVTPGLLWPPNHKLTAVNTSLKSTDVCGASSASLVAITSNEPDEGLGDGDEPNDIQKQPDGALLLRAERSGTGAGRIYELTFEASDAAGNKVTKKAQVEVPKNR